MGMSNDRAKPLSAASLREEQARASGDFAKEPIRYENPSLARIEARPVSARGGHERCAAPVTKQVPQSTTVMMSRRLSRVTSSPRNPLVSLRYMS